MKYVSIDSFDGTALPGALVSAVVEVVDAHGRARSDTITAGVKDSNGDTYPVTSTITRLSTGLYRVDLSGLDDADTYRVVLLGTDTGAEFNVIVSAGVPVPDLADIKGYLGTAVAAQWADGEIQDALDGETQRQRDNCTIPTAYPASLADALRRRVARNLAARALPLAYRSDGEGSVTRLGGEDAIVKRIEDHYPSSASA